MLQTATRHEGLVLTTSDHEAVQTLYLNRQYIFYDHSNNILKTSEFVLAGECFIEEVRRETANYEAQFMLTTYISSKDETEISDSVQRE